MKELNVTEAQLRSWRPRQPAAGLKRKILTTDVIASPTTTWLWGGLAPAMACVLMTLMMINHGGDSLGAKSVTAMILSNQSYAAYATGGEQTAQNHLAGVTFDWTNHSGFKSIIGFTPTTNFSN
jgi:hypothetical protein